MTDREQSDNDTSSDDRSQLSSPAKNADVKEIVLRKLYPSHGSPQRLSSSSSSSSPEVALPRRRPQVHAAVRLPECLLPPCSEQRPAVTESSASAAASATNDGTSSSSTAEALATWLSEDDADSTEELHPQKRRRRARRRGAEGSAAGSRGRPDVGSPDDERRADGDASLGSRLPHNLSTETGDLSRNRKRKLKKRRRRDERRQAAVTQASRDRVAAKQFFYDDSAEAQQKGICESEKRAGMIKEFVEFVLALAEMHSFQSHVTWDAVLNSFTEQMAALDTLTLSGLLSVKTLLVLNDGVRSRTAIASHLTDSCCLSPDVISMLSVLFDYWLTSVMA